MGGRTKRLRDELAGLWELGHRALQAQDYEAAADLLGGIDRVMDRELPAAQVQARAEARQRAAERAADPDAPRLRLNPENPSGWVADPAHRARMSPSLLRRIDEDDARERAEAARQERHRAQQAAERQDAAIMDRWREDVALGIATVADLPRYQEAQVGRTHAEALAYYSATQDAEDARLAAAAVRYGQMVAAVFGADGDKALAALLESDDKPVGARVGRERGWG